MTITVPIRRSDTFSLEGVRSIMQMMAPWDSPCVVAATFNQEMNPRRFFLVRNGERQHVDAVIEHVSELDEDADVIVAATAPTFHLTTLMRSGTQKGEPM